MPDVDRPRVILASASPRRRELLRAIVPPQQTLVRPAAGFVEPPCPVGASVAEVARFVEELAAAKAAAAAAELTAADAGALVLAADTLVVFEDGGHAVPLGKPPEDSPGYEQTVCETLRRLSDRSHHVVSGVCVISEDPGSGRESGQPSPPRTEHGFDVSTSVQTTVTFGQISDAAAAAYAATGEPRGKAGGYAIQGIGAAFVRRVEGSLSNVIGLPVEETRRLLSDAGLAA